MAETLPETTSSELQRRSVHAFPTNFGGITLTTLVNVASVADDVHPWWSPQRDRDLDRFWKEEPFLAGAIYAVAARNASFRWEITGPAEDAYWVQELLTQADFGRGWQQFIMKLTLDLLTQDQGAAFEIIRPARARTNKGIFDAIKMPHPDSGEMVWWMYDPDTGKFGSQYEADFKIVDSPLDLPIGIAHLDIQRCERSGDPDYPIIYTDLNGKWHKMSRYQVATLEDMPSPRENMKGIGVCAVSRCLRLAQILRDLTVYKHEKVSGRFARAIHLTNADAQQLNDVIEQSNEAADTRGLKRYIQPFILAVLDPNATPKVATIPLASLPDGFSEDETMRWYIAGVANALGVDYGFLAPLPGNKLGTSTQAEVQERQSRGKSSRLFMNMMEFKFNYSGILPRSTTFRFAVANPWEESERDRALARRARAYNTLVQSGILEPWMARQMLADTGDIDPKYLELLGEADATPIVTISGIDKPAPRFTPRVDPRLLAQWQQQMGTPAQEEEKPQ